jgi:hypothetical protein
LYRSVLVLSFEISSHQSIDATPRLFTPQFIIMPPKPATGPRSEPDKYYESNMTKVEEERMFIVSVLDKEVYGDAAYHFKFQSGDSTYTVEIDRNPGCDCPSGVSLLPALCFVRMLLTTRFRHSVVRPANTFSVSHHPPCSTLD